MKKIIKILCLGAAIFTIASCGTTTNITGSWKKPGATASQFKSVLYLPSLPIFLQSRL